MKVGDKLMCKKRFKTNVNVYWEKGQEYEIMSITNDVFYSILTERYEDGWWAYGFNINGRSCKEGEHIWDVFYKPVELRKRKLESLY